MMIVLAVLVFFAVLAIPRMMSGLRRSRLDRAVDAIRGDLQFARARAASTGLRHAVVADAASRHVLVQPYRPEEAEAANAAGGAPDFALQDPLPDDINVTTWSVSPVSPPNVPAESTSDVLTFYPEGRSDSLLVVLEDDEGSRRALQLEGFTGELRELTDEELGQLAR